MKGHCLCGAVGITAPDNPQMSACHCSMCRRWGGGPFLTVHCGPDVRISGSEHVTAFRCSDWAERAFCARCGAHLYYRLVPANEYIMAAGLFQDGTAFQFSEQIFVDEKPGSYAFANDTSELTGAEVFAKYAPPG
jgi:hypothetical protein